MKLRFVIAGVFLAASFATSAQAAEVYTFTTAGVEADDRGSVSLGFTFTANSNVIVTSLGYFDFGGDGFLLPHEVGIFAGNGGVASGPLLASTTLAAGMSGTLGANDFRYQDLTTPLALIAGQQYTIAGFRPDSGSLWDPYLFGGPSNTTGFSVVPQITIGPNAALFIYGSPFTEPSSHYGTYEFYGVNFTIAEVPEPSTWSMLLIGLAGLAFLAYRRAPASSIRVQPLRSDAMMA